MGKPKRKKFSGEATSLRQVANDLRSVLFAPNGAIAQHHPAERKLSKAEERWRNGDR